MLAENPLPSETRLTRVVSMRAAFGVNDGRDLQKLVGRPRVERGFLSTSKKTTFEMKHINDPVTLNVISPRGTPAAAIEDISKVPNQYELLLGRGLGYTIVNPRYVEGRGRGEPRCVSIRRAVRSVSALDSGIIGAQIETDLSRIAHARESYFHRGGPKLPLQDAEEAAGLTEADIWAFLDEGYSAAS